MKIALCLYGLTGSKNDKWGRGVNLDPKFAYNYYFKNFFRFNKNVDVFIHSQSYENRNKLMALYKPKKFLIEKKKSFIFSLNEHPAASRIYSIKLFLIDLIKYFSDFISPKEKMRIREKKIINCYSRWYSSKAVLVLKKKYEIQNNFRYDIVFLSRLDMALLTPFKMNQFNKKNITVSNSNYFPDLSKNFLDKPSKKIIKKQGTLDFWFAGSSENLDKLGLIYDKIKDYDINPHFTLPQHLKKMRIKISHKMYRWFDYELIRFKFFNSKI